MKHDKFKILQKNMTPDEVKDNGFTADLITWEDLMADGDDIYLMLIYSAKTQGAFGRVGVIYKDVVGNLYAAYRDRESGKWVDYGKASPYMRYVVVVKRLSRWQKLWRLILGK